jgi:VanZ family protein
MNSASRRNGKELLANWAPVVLWAGMICYFSTEQFSSPQTSGLLESALDWLFPGISAERVDWAHLVLRKLGHLTEYFVFSVLLLRAWRSNHGGLTVPHVAWSVMFVLLYAASDEFHQAFVPSRTASINDVLIDVLGGICGTLWIAVQRKGDGVAVRSGRTTHPPEMP